jgi:hypothetical protein
MLNGKCDHAVFPDETPETRHRLHDAFDAFEKLEKELRHHIDQLRAKQLERVAAALGLLSAVPKERRAQEL